MLVNKTEDKRKMTVGALNKKVDESLTDLKKQLLDSQLELMKKVQDSNEKLESFKAELSKNLAINNLTAYKQAVSTGFEKSLEYIAGASSLSTLDDLSQKIEMLVNNVEKLQEDVDELKTYKPSKRNRFWLF
jgi:phage shock protein A